MAKKLIITDKQYDRIHKLLLESADIKNTLKQAKIGDILSFKGVNSILKLKVTNINQSNGDIMGDTEKGDKVTLNVNSFNQVTKMIEYKKALRQQNRNFLNQGKLSVISFRKRNRDGKAEL